MVSLSNWFRKIGGLINLLKHVSMKQLYQECTNYNKINKKCNWITSVPAVQIVTFEATSFQAKVTALYRQFVFDKYTTAYYMCLEYAFIIKQICSALLERHKFELFMLP